MKVMKDHVCIDCEGSFSGGPSAMRCPACRKRHTYAGFLSTGNIEGQGTANRRHLKAGTTLIRTGRRCRVCGQEIVHIQDAAGWPVGPHDYFTCAAGTCKDVWRRAAKEVAEDFWGFSPSSENRVWQTIQSPIFETGRKGAQR